MQKIGVIGSGAMGSGIAQVAATAGHTVILYDNNPDALKRSEEKLISILDRLVVKGRLGQEERDGIQHRIGYADSMFELVDCELVIEAIVENLAVKKSSLRTVRRYSRCKSRFGNQHLFSSGNSYCRCLQATGASPGPALLQSGPFDGLGGGGPCYSDLLRYCG